MLTAINYNCNPDSLADVSREDFVNAFENEVHNRPEYRDLDVSVCFQSGVSRITKFTSNDWKTDILREDEFHKTFTYCANRAFECCCS